MKRVLSLALVAVMALGMGMGAFASLNVDLENIKDFYEGKTLADGVANYSVTNDVVDMGTVRPQDKPEVVIDLRTDMFGSLDVDYTETYAIAVDTQKMIDKGYLPGPATTYTSFTLIDGALTTDAENAGLMTRADLAAMYASSSPADRANHLYRLYNKLGLLKKVIVNDDDVFLCTAMKDDGDWANTTLFGLEEKVIKGGNLSSTQIRKSKLSVGASYKAGSGLIKDIELVQKDGQIVVKLVDEFVSTKSQDIELYVYLRANGKRLDNKGITILATLENPITEVYSDANYVNLSDGYVAEAIEFNSKIAVDMGNGVTLHTKMFKAKKYYAKASRESDEEAERVFKQYKEVDNVISLKTVGLNSVGDYVTLSTDYSGYYVYDKDLNYLGKGDEELTFSNKLYLAYEKLEIEEEEEEEVEEAPLPTTPENPETGGDGNAASNVNLNPGTGR